MIYNLIFVDLKSFAKDKKQIIFQIFLQRLWYNVKLSLPSSCSAFHSFLSALTAGPNSISGVLGIEVVTCASQVCLYGQFQPVSQLKRSLFIHIEVFMKTISCRDLDIRILCYTPEHHDLFTRQLSSGLISVIELVSH